MIVISDTSPITNLMQVNQLEILQLLFGQVIIPKTVYQELCEIQSQKVLLDKQNWITVQEASNKNLQSALENELDKGEAEAIVLALELKADFLIIDEQKGRQVAAQHGLTIVGLLGTLIRAKTAGFIQAVKPILDQLILDAGFRIHPSLYQQIMEIVNEN
jgi:predicted nucleic acid-binding protein